MRRRGSHYSHSSERYTRRAFRCALLLSYIPFSRAYFLTGSVAKERADMKSDIDIVALTREHYVWLHRAILFIFLSLLGMRRTKKRRGGKICISASLSKESEVSLLTPTLIPLWRGTSRLTLLEDVLVFTRLGLLADYMARYSISYYIMRRFANVKAHPDTVIRMSRHHIEYYPPRTDSSASLDGLSSPLQAPVRS